MGGKSRHEELESAEHQRKKKNNSIENIYYPQKEMGLMPLGDCSWANVILCVVAFIYLFYLHALCSSQRYINICFFEKFSRSPEKLRERKHSLWKYIAEKLNKYIIQ